MVLPFLMCGCCKFFYDSENYPVQSIACGHSICKSCVVSEGQKNPAASGSGYTSTGNSNNNNNQASVTGGNDLVTDRQGYYFCPICHIAAAFHAEESKPNLLACAAIVLLKDCDEILEAHQQQKQNASASAAAAQRTDNGTSTSAAFRERTDEVAHAVALNKNAHVPSNNDNELISSQESDNRRGRSPARLAGASLPYSKTSNQTMLPTTPPTNNNSVVSNTTCNKNPEEEINTPTSDSRGSFIQRRHNQTPLASHAKRTTTNRKRAISLSPPQAERMVWVKFSQGSQLAYLLFVDRENDTATIRWESSKYVEEVSMDKIEELESVGRVKRSRTSSSRAIVNHYDIKSHKKSKKRSKNNL